MELYLLDELRFDLGCPCTAVMILVKKTRACGFVSHLSCEISTCHLAFKMYLRQPRVIHVLFFHRMKLYILDRWSNHGWLGQCGHHEVQSPFTMWTAGFWLCILLSIIRLSRCICDNQESSMCFSFTGWNYIYLIDNQIMDDGGNEVIMEFRVRLPSELQDCGFVFFFPSFLLNGPLREQYNFNGTATSRLPGSAFWLPGTTFWVKL